MRTKIATHKIIKNYLEDKKGIIQTGMLDDFGLHLRALKRIIEENPNFFQKSRS